MPEAVEGLDGSDLHISGIEPDEVRNEPDGMASYTLTEWGGNTVILTPDGEAWLLEVPFPTGR